MWDPHGLGSAFAGELLLLLPRCFALLHSPFSLQRCANMKPSAGLVSPWGCRQCLLRPPKEVSQENFPEETKAEKVKGFCGDAPALLSSMGQEKMAKVPEEPMLFCDDIFSIEPMEGEIGPNCSAKVQVTFKPLEALEYGRVAYCSISGRESRLPLHLRGEGQGPLVELSSHTLNLGNILVNTPQVYEVKLINQGALDAPFTRIPSATNGGFCFKFAPEEGIIAAGGSQTLQISFRATVLGSFEEEFQFRVAGSPRPAILTIKGSVTGPSLRFDLPELDFGDISFGFPYTQSCRLTNTSAVPLTFKLRMSDDGTQPAVDSVDQIRRHSDPAWRKGIHFYVEPREFTMNPSHGTILPQGHQDIQVTLCSNTVMEFYRRLLVDVEGIGKGVASLPITASSDCPGVISLPRCLVPKLQVYPQVLLYEECQLKVPYERKLFISNPSHLPGCYGLIPQKRKEDSPVLYSSPRPCGIVQPHSIAEIPVLVEVQALGTHRTNVLIGVFGDERNPLRPELRSSGWLAEISPSPRLAEFGRTPALQPIDELPPPKFQPRPPKEKRACLDCPASRWRHFRMRKEEAGRGLKEVQGLTQSSGVEAFSVLPLSAVLQPGESQQVSSTVSGHLNTISSVPALCHVEGGPTCEVGVTGGASRVSSSLSPRGINCGSRAPLRERRELKRLAPKLGEEAKALEEEERRKKEKKGVPVGKQPPKPEKGKTKPPGKKETKASEKKETNIPKKETKPAEKKETKAPGKKETKAPEKDTKPPEKKESKVLKNKTKFPENKNKPPEKKESKIPERKAAKIQEKETKAPEKKEAKAPKKGEPKAPKKGEPKAYYSVRY
ncbi:hydrocephalus-inducing protein-like isoform X2 [Motacilla alba alba]|uniref:hydrocephalus-inducing protein-like isoform X2 n=1 Tax=Motacilla alba alba TaxID=1094192 RepID=UPI0018D583DA|nr:hydrocephalus-inducing protein-like isoform X2 [Motacilla alba alba]